MMDLNEKLQELRRKKGLTQEELAGKLFVSRTAVSKWESGRGYPSIDSLKAIAKFFGVTVDELLSGEELLTVAEEDAREKKKHFRDRVFGLLDCSTVMFFFMPLFGQRGDAVEAVSLPALTGIAPYLKALYFAAVIALAASGMLNLALRSRGGIWAEHRSKISLGLNALGVLLFIVSLQPYAAAMLFVFLLIKVLMLLKWQ